MVMVALKAQAVCATGRLFMDERGCRHCCSGGGLLRHKVMRTLETQRVCPTADGWV
jgi:hypothetical protein